MQIRQLRSFINRWSPQVTVVAIVLLAIALYIVLQTGRDRISHEPLPVYFYDLNTGELFTALSSDIPPIEAPSGLMPDGEPAGVRAFVYSCGSCSDPSQRRIAWLEKYTPEAKARALAMQSWPHGSADMAEEDEIYDEFGDPLPGDVYGPPTQAAPQPSENEPGPGEKDELTAGDTQVPTTQPGRPWDQRHDPGRQGAGQAEFDMMGEPIDPIEGGQLVRRLDGDTWHLAHTEEGMTVMQIDSDVCGEGGRYMICMPESE